MAFPAGTYGVSLGGNVHASFAGTLTVTQNTDGTFSATYQHGNQPNPIGVDFSFTTEPDSISFNFNNKHANPNVKFLPAILEANGTTFGPGTVTGLPKPEKDDDTWTATFTPLPGGDHEHHKHEHHEHGHKKH
jgi:hypothetical protein